MNWSWDDEGTICPPVWSNPEFLPDPSGVPNYYAYDLTREDYAFTSRLLLDFVMSVEYRSFYGSVVNGGVVFRAVDSSRFYVLDVVDLGRKGGAYEVALWLQEGTGYRRELASGLAPHSEVPEHILQMGPKDRKEWERSGPEWVKVYVRARGPVLFRDLAGEQRQFFRVTGEGPLASP